MSGPTVGSSASAPLPVGPTERLSFTRLAIVLLALALVIGVVAVKVSEALESSSPLAQSWSVPYVDVTLSPTYQFQDPQSNPARDIALAFVVADPDRPCQPTWGASYTLAEAGEQLELDRRISQLRASGGDVVISFGGRDNDELAVSCTDQDDLVEAYRDVIERYDVSVIDLDIEGPALADSAATARRAEALAELQDEREADGEVLDVWLTLPVATTGLTAEGLAVVNDTVDGGLDLLGVNAMTMNYNSGSASADMFGATRSALEAAAGQIGDVYARLGTPLDESQRWAHLGATPMIGQNDVDGEIFTLEDAADLAELAVDKGLGRVSTWSLNRDQPCGAQFADVAVHSNTCSGVAQQPLAFAQQFTNLPGRPPAGPPSDAITVPNRQTVVDDPETSPYPIWRPTAQYPDGYKVVWHGLVYQAKWYNQGADPSTKVDNQWDTPWALLGPVGPDDRAPTITTIPAGTYPAWDATTLYESGDRVDFVGLPYQARWSTKGEAPSTQFPVGPDSPWQPLFTVPGEPAA
jgi:chitinase